MHDELENSQPEAPVESSKEAGAGASGETPIVNAEAVNSTETTTNNPAEGSATPPPTQPEPVVLQNGILADSTAFGYYLTYCLSDDELIYPLIVEMLARFHNMIDECARTFNVPSLTAVVAVGSEAWDKLYGEAKPAALKAFPEMKQADRVAPATPCDLFFQIRSDRHDINFNVARRIQAILGEIAQLQEAVPTFRYLESRDLTGFVDGTENPEGEHRHKVAIVGPEDADFAGGSYVHIQRYIHDLPSWNQQSVEQQEQIIGRTKTDNIEFKGDKKLPTSHIKRAGIKDEEGKAVEILRQSMPYGDLNEQGLYFVSYCRFADNFTRMLASMIYQNAEGHHDHLMGFTQAVTGAALFAPARSFLTRYVGFAAKAEQLRIEHEAAEAARLAAELAEQNSTRAELAYTPLSDELLEPEIDIPEPAEPQSTESNAAQVLPTPLEQAKPPAKRYSAGFYQAMIEDAEAETKPEQPAEPKKPLNALPWSLTDAGKQKKDPQ
ncbi:Dyp-type peroxidase family [Oceanospirillum multiglobuliferum]|uniref:Peroxidase n=1 Tax=Oceanospirillum multiglobuliferum TaxID=64969 RepID=A0A1T4LBT4_9GAMM|nr:Dyp-type peroxidase [Oceanospirillum multiglobuliferum]OPX56726.1 hypothetical protein BTE48_02220 [Oceanospirillum multiglobuliferum]SJZ51964.1 Dyp-type peroxidase family [Oceanospirillum multiglobuliferum]